MEPLDEKVDHVRGSPAGGLIVEYGDYECPYSRHALDDDNLHRYAAGLGLDVALFDRDRAGARVLGRVRRDVDSGIASGQVQGTPTLFIDGVVHPGGYDAATLLEALVR